MPSSAIPRENTSGSGSGCRPSRGLAGAASRSSSSTKTAPGRWPRSYSARPGRPSRYQRTSASTISWRCAAVQAASTTGAIMACRLSDRLTERAQCERVAGRTGLEAVLREHRRAARPAAEPVLAEVDVEPHAVARDEIGRVPRGIEVLAGPAARGHLDVRAALHAQARAGGVRQLRPADLGAVSVLLGHHVRRLEIVDRRSEA